MLADSHVVGERGRLSSSNADFVLNAIETLPAATHLRARAAVVSPVGPSPRSRRSTRGRSRPIAPRSGGLPRSSRKFRHSCRRCSRASRRPPAPERYGRIGVEDPATAGAATRLVRISGSDGAVIAEALLGRQSRSIGASPRGGTFVRKPHAEQAWLVEGTVTLPQTLTEWTGTILHVPATAVRRVAIREGGRTIYEAAKPPGEAAYQLVAAGVPAEAAATDDSALKSLTRIVVSLTAVDVRARAEVAFPDDAREVAFETEDGLVITARFGEAPGFLWTGPRPHGRRSGRSGSTGSERPCWPLRSIACLPRQQCPSRKRFCRRRFPPRANRSGF